MTGFGTSRSILDKWTYVQDTAPTDERDGVRWIDTSDGNTAYVYNSTYGDWMKESRIWAQDTQPSPRVGPLDGDQWIDTSQQENPTYVYSVDTGGWERPIPNSTQSSGSAAGYLRYIDYYQLTSSYSQEVDADCDGVFFQVEEYGTTGTPYDVNLDVTFVDGVTNSYTLTLQSSQEIVSDSWTFEDNTANLLEISTAGEAYVDVDLHRIALPQHSHTI